MTNNSLSLEKRYHNKIAEDFLKQREYDFIWEIPEELFIMKKKYLQNKSIVEMGCGPSFAITKTIRRLKIKLNRYIGIDISNKMILLAKKFLPHGKYLVADITNVNLPSLSCDTILSLGALHHTEKQYHALLNWIRILKNGGSLLLREPTYEALKKGMGASPIEEGIRVNNVCAFLKRNKCIVYKKIYFCSNIFHLVNRILIKFFGNFWKQNKVFWYPIMIIDIFLCNSMGYLFKQLRGDACIIIAQKI